MMRFNLNDTEKEILKFLWDHKQWTSGAEFWEYFNKNGKAHKRQTVNTYLSRMTDKGLLVKHNKKYIYALTEKEYEKEKAKEVLDELYDGSLRNFISALTGCTSISKEDALKLKIIIDENDVLQDD